MPHVYVCPQEAPNAFATGRSAKHVAVAGMFRMLGSMKMFGGRRDAHPLAPLSPR